MDAGFVDSGSIGSNPDASSSDATTPIADTAPEFDASAPWDSVSFGITTKDVGTGSNVAIAYGGYTATDEDSQDWVTELTRVRLASLDVGRIYAVRGPKDADYSSREIGNSTLAAALAANASAEKIVIVAHSSGGFVADELFTFVSSDVMAKITYLNLDGGSWSMDSAMVAKMRGVYICNAHDPVAGNSENTSSDESLHASLAGSHLFTVDATGSGCNVGAGWCLHDTLIIDKPHDPTTYDLALDYTDFASGRHVVTSYFDQAATDGAL
ncbi:MAG: hypothetical protein ACRELY_09180 [Polyangiaceae bacterium]